MARLFNIYFTHDDILHSAIVSVHTTSFFTEYILGNLDAELKLLLPGNKVISQPEKNLFFPDIQPEHSLLLIKAILKSINKHLHAGNDVQLEA